MSEAESVDWESVGYVISSGYREAVIEVLGEKPATPSAIAKESDRSISHISRALKNLRNEGMVELLVPEERKKGRIYALTDHGERVLTEMGEVAQ